MIAPRAVAATACAVAILLAAPAPPASSTMTEEDVVRMFVAGTPTETILEAIAAREPRFDLSEEMLEELRRAGLPRELIEAMLERTAAPSEPAPEPVRAPDPPPELRILLDLDPEPAIATPLELTIDAELDRALAERFRLEPDADAHTIADVALFVACRSREHLPRSWRSKSPLGRDFVSMPRHRLLAFVAGARQLSDDGGGAGRLALELPPALELPLAPDVPHDLIVGLALQAGDRYYRWADARLDGLVLADRDAVLRAILILEQEPEILLQRSE